MLEGKSEKLEVPRDVELTPLKNKMSKNKTKTLKKELRELENQRKMMEKERWIKDNEKWSFMKGSLVWSPWNIVWAYLSFLSETRTLAYITYLKSPFWLNVDTWTEKVFPWENRHNQQGCCLFSSANKKILINLSLVWDEFWIVKYIIGQ